MSSPPENSPSSPKKKLKKKKMETIYKRREKCKTQIESTMEQIYQEEEKNSKIIKYLLNTHTNKHMSSKSNFFTPPNFFSPSVKSVESPKKGKIKNNWQNLDIEQPEILQLYENFLDSPKIKKNLKFKTENKSKSDFESILKNLKTQYKNFIQSNEDILSKIKVKQEGKEILRKKKKNAKETTIKTRWVKMKSQHFQENNLVLIEKINNIDTIPFINKNDCTFNSIKPKKELSPQTSSKNIKQILKKNIEIKNIKNDLKISSVDKIKQKYNFSNKKHEKMGFAYPIKNPFKIRKEEIKTEANPLENADLDLLQFENKFDNFQIFQGIDRSKEKFNKFYDNLLSYCETETKNKQGFRKNILDQTKKYDLYLKDFNARLFEFNANLDKDFNKDVLVSSGGIRKQNVFRLKRHK